MKPQISNECFKADYEMPCVSLWFLLESIIFYLTFCTFSFESKESSLSDTRCCITTLWW